MKTTLDDAVSMDLLLAMDDLAFCEILLTVLGAHAETPEDVLYLAPVLSRLHALQHQHPSLFFGHFLTPLRRAFPHKVFIGDLFASMKVLDWDANGQGGVIDAQTFTDAALEWQARGGQPGIAPGWRRLSEHYRIRPGELTLVGGQPNHGKSSFVQALAVNLAQRDDWQFAIFSPEHDPLGELSRALVETYTGCSERQLTPAAFQTAVEWVVRHFRPIVAPEDVAPTVPWLLANVRDCIEEAHIRGVILDPWNTIDHQLAGRTLNETQYVSEALSRIRRFARHHQVHVWLVAHPTKMQRAERGPYMGKYPPPSPYDISGSSHFYAKADNCLCVWRDVAAAQMDLEIHIQKVRYRVAGKIGMVPMRIRDYRLEECEDVPL